MAKTSSIQKNEKRIRLAKLKKAKRDALRAILRDPNVGVEVKMKAQIDLQKMPRDSSPCRIRNRCIKTGRPRGVYRRFGLGRNELRRLVALGLIPGLRKASW